MSKGNPLGTHKSRNRRRASMRDGGKNLLVVLVILVVIIRLKLESSKNR
jgi:hypothetical protein